MNKMGHASVYILLFFIKLISASVSNKDCVDYYWRDYYGIIPDNAVPAGTDSKGDPLYIGQAYFSKNKLLPATIHSKEKIARTGAGSEVLTTKKYVKILCSPHKEAFEWILVQSEDLHKYTTKLIPGESDLKRNLYIGRVFRNNSTIIGKIFSHESSFREIWFSFEDGPVNSLIYEILVYNCEKVQSINFDPRLNSD